MKKYLFLLKVSIVIFLIVAAFYDVPSVLVNSIYYRFVDKPTESEGDYSVFENTLNAGSYSSTGLEVFEVDTGFTESELSNFEDFIAFRDTVLTDWNSENWNWEDSFTYVHVKQINLLEPGAVIKIIHPDNRDFSGLDRNVIVDCSLENTAVVTAKNLSMIELGIDFFDSIHSGYDGLFAYCLDEKCMSVGRMCIIVKDIWDVKE